MSPPHFVQNFKIVVRSCLQKPRLFHRLVGGYLKSKFQKSGGSMRFMDIALSYKCNFVCHHCSALDLERQDKKGLTLQEYQGVAQQAMKMGVVAFHFTGGEPLLRNDIFDIIKVFNPNRNLISIQTNGWHVDEAFLKQYCDIGGNILCISVDSSVAKKHDDFRRKEGSWDRAIWALKRAKQCRLQTLMSFTLTHQNMGNGEFDKMIALSKEVGATLSLNLAVPAGKWRGAESFLLDATDRKNLNAALRKHPHVRTDFESNWNAKGCPAFKEKCYLTPYGDILPCPFIQVSFGNIRMQPLSGIRDTALQHPYLQRYHPICIAAEDRNFIQHASCYDRSVSELPISYTASELFAKPVPCGTCPIH